MSNKFLVSGEEKKKKEMQSKLDGLNNCSRIP